MNNRIPFDLEAAKAGKPIQCRDGTLAKIIAHVPELPSNGCVLVMSHGRIFHHYEDGSYMPNGDIRRESRDLFMIVERKTAWANIYKLNDIDSIGHLCDSREEADKLARAAAPIKRVAVVEISYVEGEGLNG